MLQATIVASPAPLVTLAVCALGIGFMVRFLVALAGEESKIRVMNRVRSRGVHYAPDGAGEPRRYGATAVDPAGYLAMGVLRITTALASNPGREGKRAVAEKSNIGMFAGRERERDSAAEWRYRLS
jgi:hypothetical protein